MMNMSQQIAGHLSFSVRSLSATLEDLNAMRRQLDIFNTQLAQVRDGGRQTGKEETR
jgi:hypothetical protein